MSSPQERQEGKTYGHAWMYRWLIAILKCADIRWLYAFMKICVIPITLIISPGARLAFRYYRRKTGCSWWRAWWMTYRNHVVFGETVIDKFAIYAGHQFKINYCGQDSYAHLTGSPEPFIQLCAHIGCAEVIGYSYVSDKPSNVLVYGGENKSLMKYRAKAFRNGNIRMIPLGGSEVHSASIVNALERGEIINAFADRLLGTTRALKVDYHGREVRVARGPLSIAVTRGLDVIMSSAMKETDGSYTAYITPLHYDKSASKHDQLQQLALAYITEKERLLAKYPLQWFNYSKQTES